MAPKTVKANKKNKAKGSPAKKPVKKAVTADSSSEDSDDSESEEEVAPKPVAKKQNGVKAQAESDSSESDDSSEEETAPPPKKNKKAPAPAKKAPPPAEDSDSEESSDEEEAAAPVKNAAKKVAKKDESESESSSEEESGEEEEPPKTAKKGPAKKAAKAESEESDEEESDDEEEMDVEEQEKPKKRKADQEAKPAKKQKVDQDVTIMIRNLDESLSDEKIVKFLKTRGVETTGFRRNVKKGYGFLDLADPEALSVALELSGEELKGKEIQIEQAENKKQSKEKGQDGNRSFNDRDQKDAATLFIKNLAYSSTEDDVRAHFPEAVAVRLPLRDDGKIKGFAFVEFPSENDAESAISEKQGSDLNGRAIYIDYTGSKAKQGGGGGGGDRRKSSGMAGETKVLFVKNLSFQTTKDDLVSAFEGCMEARIALRDDGKSKGFGFVDFSSPDDAKSAYEAMQGAELDGRSIVVDYASERGQGGGGFTPNRGGGRGGFRGGRGGFRGRGGGDRGRGGRGGFRGGRGGGRGGVQKKEGIRDFAGSKKTFDD